MRLLSKILVLTVVSSFLLLTGCGSQGTEGGGWIIDAKTVSSYLAKENVVIIDMQKSGDYAEGHIKGAVNITRNDIVINTPVENMLAPKEVIEEVMGKNGISDATTVLVYDNNNNMDAARLWWTMLVYGHENVKVVSGGLKALRSAGLDLTTEKASISPAQFTAKEANTALIATKDEVLAQLNDPDDKVILLDTRTEQEYNEGTIPGSVLYDYANNNFNDGTFKTPQIIKIDYIEIKITSDRTVIMYCKTSVRAAQTYLALYNAGYRNLKLYDGAWLEWSSDESLPVQKPSGNKVESGSKDNS